MLSSDLVHCGSHSVLPCQAQKSQVMVKREGHVFAMKEPCRFPDPRAGDSGQSSVEEDRRGVWDVLVCRHTCNDCMGTSWCNASVRPTAAVTPATAHRQQAPCQAQGGPSRIGCSHPITHTHTHTHTQEDADRLAKAGAHLSIVHKVRRRGRSEDGQSNRCEQKITGGRGHKRQTAVQVLHTRDKESVYSASER